MKFKRKIKLIKNGNNPSNNINSIMSYYGWMKHSDCRQLFTKYVDKDIQNIIAENCILLKQKNPLEEVLI